MRYPVRKLVPVLLASAVPFALRAVYPGAALIEDRRLVFLLILRAGLAAAGVVAHMKVTPSAVSFASAGRGNVTHVGTRHRTRGSAPGAMPWSTRP